MNIETFNRIDNLFSETVRNVTENPSEWKKFLTTASWSYNRRFDEQILIYAQRPSATAVLMANSWSSPERYFGRYVNSGEKGIPLYKAYSPLSQKGQGVIYVFDVEQTHETKSTKRKVSPWKLKDDYEGDVIQKLRDTFDFPIGEKIPSGVNLVDAIFITAEMVANASLVDFREEYIDSDVAEITQAMQAKYCNLVTNSIAYMMLKRLDLNADEYLHTEDFVDIQLFSEERMLISVGTTVRDNAFMGLKAIAKTVLDLDKENLLIQKNQRRYDYGNEQQRGQSIDNGRDKGENSVQASRGLSDTRFRDTRTARGTAREVRFTEVGLASGKNADNIHSVSNSLSVGRETVRERAESTGNGGEISRAVLQTEGSDGRTQEHEPDGMGTGDGDNSGTSNGNSTERSGVHTVNQTDNAKAEDKKSSAFSIPQEVIIDTLTVGTGYKNGKYRVYEQFSKSLSAKENREILNTAPPEQANATPEQQKDTSDELIGKEVMIDDHRFVIESVGSFSGDVSMRDITMQGQRIPINRIEKIDFVRRLLEEQSKDTEEKHYEYHLGDSVYIGATQYEILSFDNEIVMLYDFEYPLFNKEFSRDEFDRKVRENPMNDHLIAKDESEIRFSSNEFERLIPQSMRYKQAELVNGNEIYWVTQNVFTVEELEEFQKAVREYDGNIKKFYVTSRSISPSYVFEDDRANNILATVTADTIVAEPYVNAIREEGLGEYLEEKPVEEKEEELITEVITEPTETPTAEPITEVTTEPVTPKWEQNKKPNSFDLHPNIPISERNTFDLKSNPVEEVGKKERFRRNIMAIQLLKKCQEENRFATAEEQQILSKYVGWGGLSEAFDENNTAWATEYLELSTVLTPEEYASARESTLTAFYTPPEVISAIYKTMERMGFKEGNLLEPSCGIGNFIGMLPENMQNSRVYGVELDSISARIAQQLYQKSNIACNGYEKTDLKNNFFDVAVGNVPFGNFPVFDRNYSKNKFLIHDYFFAKTLDKVRPNGVIAFVTSKGTMDKKDPSVRKYIAQRAELLGAIRLPNDTFSGNAGTKVVSDILFLQKRERIIDVEPDWVFLEEDENGIAMNSYFVEHPEMVLGKMEMISGRFGEESTCSPIEGVSLADLLENAVANIHGEIDEQMLTLDNEVDDNEVSPEVIPADPTVRNYSYTVVNGKLFFRKNSVMEEQTSINATDKERIKGMIVVRDVARKLIEMEKDNYPDEEIAEQQEKLNKVYDRYVIKHGHLCESVNVKAFREDNSFSFMQSLEKTEVNDDNKRVFKEKADIFTKRTIRPSVPVTYCDTSSEALTLSLSEKAKVDMEYMSELCRKSEEEIYNELKGAIFLNPLYEENGKEEKYLPQDEYLSGNIREKIRIAKSKVFDNEEFEFNAQKLEEVKPKDLTASEISVKVGATWIPAKYLTQFVNELLEFTGGHNYLRVKVEFHEYTREWNVSRNYKMSMYDTTLCNSVYGTQDVNALKIIEDTLNLKVVQVTKEVTERDKNGKNVERRRIDVEKSAIAQSKQELIKQKFDEWIFNDPDRRDELCKIYNEKFNAIRPRVYDGSHLVFSGMNPTIKLRKHQLGAIAHILYGGNCLLAHCVGAGKTYEMVASAQESKRLGLCTKSLFVVPNHLIDQTASEYMQLYPSANILVSTQKDFDKENRKKFISRIATGDYDAIIIGQSQFQKIPVSLETQKAFLEEQIDELMALLDNSKIRNSKNSFTVKQYEAELKKRTIKLNNIIEAQKKSDDVITFEELGVDRLYIDEAHYYKNLFVYTKLSNVSGISTTSAQKSEDLFMKCRYLDNLTGGKGVVFATGTPLSNSMTEIYTMQRYLQYDTLQELGLSSFDDWVSAFGDIRTEIELSPTAASFKAKTKLAHFVNVPEIRAIFGEVADFQTPDMLKLPVPKTNLVNVTVDASEIQKNYVRWLDERGEAIHNGNVDPRVDNMLKITNEGRLLGLDQRCIDDTFPDNPKSKVNACVDNVFRIWEETAEDKLTQLVFSDLSTPKGEDKFSIYNDIRDKLITKGVPEQEIRFIHEAKNQNQKNALFAQVRNGTIRILLGSTSKMGAGTNVQDRLVALHDVDVPWRPSDLEQRKGRMVRQHNQNEEVYLFRYVTKGTFDAYSYQMIESKQGAIDQFMRGGCMSRTMEDIGGTDSVTYKELKALALDNPLMKERFELDTDVRNLTLNRNAYRESIYALQDKIRQDFPYKIGYFKQIISNHEKDLQTAKDNPNDPFVFELEGVVYDNKTEAGEAFLKLLNTRNMFDNIHCKYRGFKILTEIARDLYGDFHASDVVIDGKARYRVEKSDSAIGMIQRIENAINGIQKLLDNAKTDLANVENDLKKAQAEVDKPFPKEEEYWQKKNRLDELNQLFLTEKKPTVSFVVAGQALNEDDEENLKEYVDNDVELSEDNETKKTKNSLCI